MKEPAIISTRLRETINIINLWSVTYPHSDLLQCLNVLYDCLTFDKTSCRWFMRTHFYSILLNPKLRHNQYCAHEV
jgi:hypothetical protein